MKLGIIGAGGFAEYIIQAYKDNCPDIELSAITDRTTNAARRVADWFQISGVCDSVEQLLETEIGTVLIVTPPQTHVEYVMKALQAGKHVLVDKPVAFTQNDVDTMLELARSKGLCISTNLVLRHHPYHKKVKQLTVSAEFGRLVQIITSAKLARYPGDHWYWNDAISGGFYLNTFSHFIDLYDYIASSLPVKVFSTGNTRNGYTLVGRYPDGVQSTLTVSLQVDNENENVTTDYVFEHGVVTTYGWMPAQMTLAQEGVVKVNYEDIDKDLRYQMCLGDIMNELAAVIDNSGSNCLIDLDVVRQSVVQPLLYQRNIVD